MKKLIIFGKKKLKGTIKISGSKNSTLPILAASILNKKKIIIENVPFVNDVETMVDLLSVLGSKTKFFKNTQVSTINFGKIIGI